MSTKVLRESAMITIVGLKHEWTVAEGDVKRHKAKIDSIINGIIEGDEKPSSAKKDYSASSKDPEKKKTPPQKGGKSNYEKIQELRSKIGELKEFQAGVSGEIRTHEVVAWKQVLSHEEDDHSEIKDRDIIEAVEESAQQEENELKEKLTKEGVSFSEKDLERSPMSKDQHSKRINAQTGRSKLYA